MLLTCSDKLSDLLLGEIGNIAKSQADILPFDHTIGVALENADGKHCNTMSACIVDHDSGRPEAHWLLIQNSTYLICCEIMLQIGRLVDNDSKCSCIAPPARV